MVDGSCEASSIRRVLWFKGALLRSRSTRRDVRESRTLSFRKTVPGRLKESPNSSKPLRLNMKPSGLRCQ